MSGPLILSIFPGIDLLGRAFEEVWPEMCLVRGPDLLWGGDIRTFHPPAGRFNGVIGGPPCQSFSPLVHLLRATGKEPRHGNLIPEYERVVAEAEPTWFLMENVSPAPLPAVSGYAVRAFLLCPTWLGEAQRRERRFSFGLRGCAAPDLRRWIDYAALELPETAPAVTGDARAVPVAVGGSGRYKQRTVRGKNDGNPQPWEIANGRAAGYRRTWEERCELQGMPPDFLEGAPFTAEGKAMVLGNGVPLAMGRAIARAVRKAVKGGAEGRAEREAPDDSRETGDQTCT